MTLDSKQDFSATTTESLQPPHLQNLTKDDARLEDLGYRPELKRNFSKLETFGGKWWVLVVGRSDLSVWTIASGSGLILLPELHVSLLEIGMLQSQIAYPQLDESWARRVPVAGQEISHMSVLRFRDIVRVINSGTDTSLDRPIGTEAHSLYARRR